ncbi:hypothetical protein BGY98DRAFT_961275 [Russula aff. rugulosa BPL654]|nr:hypothetical protein BGY98DRAFT_961275 [Russula aff. rugulosa BPL654]
MYGSVLSVLSEEIILLIRLREPALELCRLVNIGDREKASLETVRILSLPELTMSASLRWATCFGEHPGHALFSRYRQHPPPPHLQPLQATNSDLCRETGWSSGGQPEGRVGPRRRLRSVPRDGIISVVMQVNGLSGYFRTIDLTVRCRTLLEFAHFKTPAGRTAETRTESTLEWEKWGPLNTRILEHDSLTWGSLVGERRATVGQVTPTWITMRDYNPFRVRRALEMVTSRGAGPGKEVTLECGSVVKVVKEMSSYRGGEWFCDDIETGLPYVETLTPYFGCEGIFMDEDNLLAEVRTEVSPQVRLFSLYGWI